jgi:hypothetical protein
MWIVDSRLSSHVNDRQLPHARLRVFVQQLIEDSRRGMPGGQQLERSEPVLSSQIVLCTERPHIRLDIGYDAPNGWILAGHGSSTTASFRINRHDGKRGRQVRLAILSPRRGEAGRQHAQSQEFRWR